MIRRTATALHEHPLRRQPAPTPQPGRDRLEGAALWAFAEPERTFLSCFRIHALAEGVTMRTRGGAEIGELRRGIGPAPSNREAGQRVTRTVTKTW